MTLKSGLQVIEIGAIRKLGCGFLFTFYSNYGRVCSRLWDISRPCNGFAVLRRVRNCRVWLIDWLNSVKEWCDLENRVRVRSRSLEMAPFDRSHTSSYLPSIVTTSVSLAILEIFCVKEWRDLEMWVWGCSRSLKIARFDRLCMTFY